MDLKKSISLKNRLKEVLKDCLLSSTGHGLAHFIKANNYFIRITWAFFIIISACLCSYMIAQNILKYLKFDVNTKIRVVNQFSAVFPTNYFHPNYGNCFQFNPGYDNYENSDDLESTQFIERLGGLRLVLNLSVPDSLKFINPNIGGIIFIHNHTTHPTVVDPVTLSPNTETNIALSRTFYELKEKPYSNCDKNTNDKNYFKSVPYYLIHNYTKGYSQMMCTYQCLQLILIKECSCYTASYPNFFDSIPCINQTYIECYRKFFMDKKNTEKYLKECIDQCPLECEGMWLDKVISVNQYSAKKYQELVQNYNGSDKLFLNKNETFDDLAIVNIYYRNLGYTEITESVTVEFVDLLSSIGGVGGLFLGASALTLKSRIIIKKSEENIKLESELHKIT
ncbi:amiloride-sensitive sodium channel subunit beta [Brachionus plicatilis]|uniref:Amiloride-sensitive sodium channel subunit beta n=1 Tax=Brachionus plicatilis TaxID=10195 RepID=A0A3M7RIH1_BRAPC|nr:amiloride-sensitive sodium channel subunit beta [Brachionus plicatilis]